MEIRNQQFNAHGTIDLEINHPHYGWVPFTASPDDVEEHGRDLYARAVAGEFGEIAPYVAPVPTPEQTIAKYEAALDQHLNSVAQAHRFNDRHSLALRAGYPSAYQALGSAFATWMDGCNVQAYQRLQRVMAGEESMPTIEEFINDLPEFVAP